MHVKCGIVIVECVYYMYCVCMVYTSHMWYVIRVCFCTHMKCNVYAIICVYGTYIVCVFIMYCE